MSLRAAIDAKCKDCIYDPKCGGGHWREQVAQCSSIDCPLWPVRPAPQSGRFANPPRDTEAVAREWVTLPVGEAVSGHPLTDRASEAARLKSAPVAKRKSHLVVLGVIGHGKGA